MLCRDVGRQTGSTGIVVDAYRRAKKPESWFVAMVVVADTARRKGLACHSDCAQVSQTLVGVKAVQSLKEKVAEFGVVDFGRTGRIDCCDCSRNRFHIRVHRNRLVDGRHVRCQNRRPRRESRRTRGISTSDLRCWKVFDDGDRKEAVRGQYNGCVASQAQGGRDRIDSGTGLDRTPGGSTHARTHTHMRMCVCMCICVSGWISTSYVDNGALKLIVDSSCRSGDHIHYVLILRFDNFLVWLVLGLAGYCTAIKTKGRTR